MESTRSDNPANPNIGIATKTIPVQQTPVSTLYPYLFEAPPVPCKITNLSSRPAAIYAEPNRNEQIGSFIQGQTLEVINDIDKKWYELASDGAAIGWFYYQDTYPELDYCNN